MSTKRHTHLVHELGQGRYVVFMRAARRDYSQGEARDRTSVAGDYYPGRKAGILEIIARGRQDRRIQ